MQRSPSSSRFVMFPAVPSVDGYTAVGSVAGSYQRLCEVVRGGEGVGVLIGPTGTGKSLLCCLLAEALREEFHVVLLADSQLNNGETLLKHILFHLNLPYRDLSEGELRLALIDHLTQGMRGSSKSALALIIDEAQGLSPKLLEEVRMITNIVRDGEPRVRTILAGSPRLEERLNDVDLESLQQRIASRCYLHPLTEEETAQYLRDALRRAGEPQRRTIEEDAIGLVHQATGGIPRLINQFMRQTLTRATTGPIDADQIDQAWQQLQQLPSPVIDADVEARLSCDAAGLAESQTEPPGATPSASIVEFGALTPENDDLDVACDGAADASPDRSAPHAEPEPIDPIAQADPQLAADLERMTESLQQLADDRSPEPMWEEESEVAAELDPADWQTHEWVTPESTDAANLQFACVAGDEEISLPDDCGGTLDGAELLTPSEASEPTIEWTEEMGAGLLAAAPDAASDLGPDVVLPPVGPAVPCVLPMEELFGNDFDEEETIPAERNYDSGAWAGEPAGSPSSVAEAKTVTGEGLEQSLRDELIGLARETVDAARPATAEPTAEPTAVTPPSEAAVSASSCTASSPAPSPFRGVAADQQEPHDIQLADDSDLLVIEEAIEVEPLRIQTPMFDDDASDSRDYEALFHRMRQG